MISKSICQTLKANSELATLAGGAARFFAENGVGDMTVTVLTITPSLETSEIPDVVRATMQIIIQGYAIDSGEVLGVKIINAINALAGTQLAVDNWVYGVKSVSFAGMPAYVPQGNAFTINFVIVYSQDLIAE
jgi:hypothetical protein